MYVINFSVCRPIKTEQSASGDFEVADITQRDNALVQIDTMQKSNPITTLINGATKALTGAIEGATEVLTSGAKAITHVVKAGYDAAKDVVDTGLRGATEVGRTLWDAITGTPGGVRPQAGIATLSSTQLSSLAPFTQFARATYCPTGKLKDWSCGGLYLQLMQRVNCP